MSTLVGLLIVIADHGLREKTNVRKFKVLKPGRRGLDSGRKVE